MPGLMLHLLLARKVNPNGSILFYLGNLAPDAVANWKDKDITHFRNLEDRSNALAVLARGTPPGDDFAQGVLLHLYMDWRWDLFARDEFIKTTGCDWFPKYRKEISLASGYAFHHTDWAETMWEQMEACDVSEYGRIPGATAGEFKEFLVRNGKWHKENNTEASMVFTPAFIEEFIGKTADEYIKWRSKQT